MIEINNLTKRYDKKVLFENINLHFETGQVIALLGKNGAGKTSLIHLILDLVKQDEGEILIMETPHNTLRPSQKAKLGVVGEDLALIEALNAEEFLTFIGKIYQMPKATLAKRIQDLFAYFFEEGDDLKKSIGKYSTGMKKKIAFCAAVIHAPDILILDEPFSGLDPLVANQMIAFLEKYKREDRLILVSSHDLSYVEKIATHISVLDKGEFVFNSTLTDFTENGEKALDAALLNLLKPNNSELTKLDWV